MLAEYAGRMLSITRGRSRVFRSRNAQFVVLSNNLDHEAFEQLIQHLKEAVFAPVRIAGDTITPVCLVVPAFYEHLTNQTAAVLGELDRRIRTAAGLFPTTASPYPRWSAKRHRRTHRSAHGSLSTQRVYAPRQRISRQGTTAPGVSPPSIWGTCDCSTNGTDRPRATAYSPMWARFSGHRECRHGRRRVLGPRRFLRTHPL